MASEPTDRDRAVAAEIDAKLQQIEQRGMGVEAHTACVREMLAEAVAKYRVEVLGTRTQRSDQCAECGESQREHHYNGACYGKCGAFVARKERVCTTCNDTHRMKLHTGSGDVRQVMCTCCPTPCEGCRSRGPGLAGGPYCARTPCACSCHERGKKPCVRGDVVLGVGDAGGA